MVQIKRDKVVRTPQISIAPLIDMVFILLIFFVVTTSFIKETGIEVIRPKAVTAKVVKYPDLLVAVTQAGLIYMEGKAVDLSMVRSIARQIYMRHPNANTIIIADENARTGLVVDVIDECRLAGAKKISIATKIEQ
jgi:biopolymer transport protein ExbD